MKLQYVALACLIAVSMAAEDITVGSDCNAYTAGATNKFADGDTIKITFEEGHKCSGTPYGFVLVKGDAKWKASASTHDKDRARLSLSCTAGANTKNLIFEGSNKGPEF